MSWLFEAEEEEQEEEITPSDASEASHDEF